VTPDGAVQVFWLGAQSNGVYSTRLALADGSRLAGPVGGFSVSQATGISWYEVAGDPAYGSFVVLEDGAGRVWLKQVNADGSLGTQAVMTPDAGVGDAGTGGGASGGGGCGCTSDGSAVDLVALLALASFMRARRGNR
jgi:uncharacterized protein (TIGR03382 family)